jgi:hypothetical protein
LIASELSTLSVWVSDPDPWPNIGGLRRRRREPLKEMINTLSDLPGSWSIGIRVEAWMFIDFQSCGFCITEGSLDEGRWSLQCFHRVEVVQKTL